MSANGPVHPDDASWVAAVHASAADFAPLGAGVVIDDRRILTCEHVAGGHGELWVAFPMAGDARRLVERVVLPGAHAAVKDLAILILATPVPDAVTPAPLRSPRPEDLKDRRWWAFGFPAGDPVGNPADGLIGATLGYGWIRLDAGSRYHIDPGFSGGGLWSPDYGAVVGIVSQANERGDGRAITVHQAIGYFPDQDLNRLSERFGPALAGPVALSAWGWSLSRDPEGVRHWRPRARGVGSDSERGYRFRGRAAALTAVRSWLDRDVPDRRVLVVTGAPGSGKSAVLGRIVTTADAAAAAELPDLDTAVRATAGSVDCAVHAKGKAALEVATEIARAASAALPGNVRDFAPAMRKALAERGGRRFNVIIDALDESPEARLIAEELVLPLAGTCADVGAQVIVGSRRRDDHGELLDPLGSAVSVVDLDDPRFFAEADLAAYARTTLQLDRPGNPYAADDAAAPVAARIAELSDGNFLIAGLIARPHGLYDEEPADPAGLSFTATVDAAMREYLQRLPPVHGVPAGTLLTALAFAEAPGLPADLWRAAALALGAGDVPVAELTRFARSAAANFLVESTGESQGAVFRLFHQALNEALRRARGHVAAQADDERSLAKAFITAGRAIGWQNAPAYLLRSLPGHAARGGIVDDLLNDDEYLLHADLAMLLPWVPHAQSAPARQRARLLRLTPRFSAADPRTRTALFSVTETVQQAGDAYTRGTAPAPYRAAWSTAAPSAEELVLEGHANSVRSVCAFSLNGRPLLASVGDDLTARTWDTATGTERSALRRQTSSVSVIAPVMLDGRPLLAVAEGANVPIWDPASGAAHLTLRGHTGWVSTAHSFTLDGDVLLATAGYDQTIRIWDVASGAQRFALHGHTDRIWSLCTFAAGGRVMLASAGGYDGTVRVWDPATGALEGVHEGHPQGALSICAFTQDGRALLAVGCGDGAVRFRDPATGTPLPGLSSGGDQVRALCAFARAGRTLLAVAADRTVQVWDPETATQVVTLTGHTGKVRTISAFASGNRTLLGSGGDDRTIRIWDPAGIVDLDARSRVPGVAHLCAFTQDGHARIASAGDEPRVRIWDAETGTEIPSAINSSGPLCAFTVDGRPLVAVGGEPREINVWDVTTSALRATLRGHDHSVTRLCAFNSGNLTLLASGSFDQTTRIWDPAAGREVLVAADHASWIQALHAFTLGGRPLLAIGYGDGTIGVRDTSAGVSLATFQGHPDTISSMGTVTVNRRTVLVTGSHDRTVAGHDPATGNRQFSLQGHSDWVTALCALTPGDRALLATGSRDRTIRIWDVTRPAALLTVPVHHPVTDLCATDDLLIVGTTAGLLAIRLDADYLAGRPGR